MFFSVTAFDGTQWFVLAILYFYLLFVVSIKQQIISGSFFVLVGTVCYIIACTVLDLGDWRSNSCLLFAFGVMWAGNEERLLFRVKNNYSIILVSSFVLTILLLVIAVKVPLVKYISSVFFVITILLILSKIHLNSKLIGLIGCASLETYILHMKLMRMFYDVTIKYNLKSSVFVWGYFVVLLLLAGAFYMLNNRLQLLISNATKKIITN